MTLTQLNAFVLVARLGSVTAAANALGVSEPAVSQALSALRQHLGDPLVSRGPGGMTLTAGGSRLLATASQIVVLGAEAHAAVRAAQGAPEQLRVVATSTIAEFVVSPLMEAFTRRFAGAVEVSSGVAATEEMAVLVANRLADVAIGPGLARDPALPVVSEPMFRYRLVVVAARAARPRGRRPPVALAGRPVRHRPGQRHRPAAGRAAASRTTGSGCSPTRPRPGPRPRTAPGWRPRSSTWSPSSCAAASCRWSRCRARRWTAAGT